MRRCSARAAMGELSSLEQDPVDPVKGRLRGDAAALVGEFRDDLARRHTSNLRAIDDLQDILALFRTPYVSMHVMCQCMARGIYIQTPTKPVVFNSCQFRQPKLPTKATLSIMARKRFDWALVFPSVYRLIVPPFCVFLALWNTDSLRV